MNEKDYQIVTVCDRIPRETYYCLDSFHKSLKGVNPLILTNELMKDRFHGLKTKPKWLYRAIKEGLITADKIIACDCWDLVFAGHPSGIIDIWHEYGSDIVVSSERNCFPPEYKEQYDTLPYKTSYRYLNSGMIVGETEAILAALEAMDLPNVPEDHIKEDGSNHHTNDQQLWMDLYLKQPVKMSLDYDQRLCCTLHSMKPEDLEFSPNGLIRNVETRFWPMSYHANGSAKTDGMLPLVLKHLNLL